MTSPSKEIESLGQIKGILKESPPKESNRRELTQSAIARNAMVASDRKRIQFDLKKEVQNVQFATEV